MPASPVRARISKTGGWDRKIGRTSSTTTAEMGTSPELSRGSSIDDCAPSAGAVTQTRRTSRRFGCGSLEKSQTQSATATASQKAMASRNLGSNHAGPIQTSPSRRINRPRGPTPPLGSNVERGDRWCDVLLFWHFDRSNNFRDHLIRGNSIEVGLRLEQKSMTQNCRGDRFHIIGNQKIATFQSSGTLCHEK